MPARGQYRPDSLPSTLRAWFADHEGLHRPVEVAAALGFTEPIGGRGPAWAVANECGRLYRQGMLRRERVPVEGRIQPYTYYGQPVRRTRARDSNQEGRRQAAREEDRSSPDGPAS